MTFVRDACQHLRELILDSSAVVYVTYFPAWKQSFRRIYPSGLSKIPPEKVDDSRSPAFSCEIGYISCAKSDMFSDRVESAPTGPLCNHEPRYQMNTCRIRISGT